MNGITYKVGTNSFEIISCQAAVAIFDEKGFIFDSGANALLTCDEHRSLLFSGIF